MTSLRIMRSLGRSWRRSSWRRKLGRQVGGLDLEKRLEPWQTLELMQAEIPEADAGSRRADGRVAGCA